MTSHLYPLIINFQARHFLLMNKPASDNLNQVQVIYESDLEQDINSIQNLTELKQLPTKQLLSYYINPDKVVEDDIKIIKSAEYQKLVDFINSLPGYRVEPLQPYADYLLKKIMQKGLVFEQVFVFSGFLFGTQFVFAESSILPSFKFAAILYILLLESLYIFSNFTVQSYLSAAIIKRLHNSGRIIFEKEFNQLIYSKLFINWIFLLIFALLIMKLLAWM